MLVLIATLTKMGRLPSSKSLTHRELASRVAFEIDAQRETFRRVATMAERSLYGSGVPRPEEIESVVEEGRNLDSKLRGASA